MARDTRTELYRFSPFVFLAVVFSAFFLQAYVPFYVPAASLLDLPLLVVIYFALSRRNPSTGLTLGLVVGVAQDALTHHPIGQYGMAKTLVGFAASWVAIRLETEQPVARLLLVFGFFLLHHVIFGGVEWLLLGQPAALLNLQMLEAALVTALLGVLVFRLLDRFRRPA